MKIIINCLSIFLIHSLYQCLGQCPERNGRFPDPTQCDAYTECENSVATRKLCPDGLVFSDNASFFTYPCVYPNQADCSTRPTLQPALPTSDCPHQFGYYPLGDENNCGSFLSCAHGIGHTFQCPIGLGFNPLTIQCDWPDLVPSCNAEGYLGFTCPTTYSPELGFPTGYTYHRASGSCNKYFICINDRPRVFFCDDGQAFNEQTNSCDNTTNVPGCGNFNQLR